MSQFYNFYNDTFPLKWYFYWALCTATFSQSNHYNRRCRLPNMYCLAIGYLLCHTAQPAWGRHQMETFSALLAICAGNSPVNSPPKGQWRGGLLFSLIYAWTNGWVNNRYADDLRRYSAHSDVTVMGLKYIKTKYSLWRLPLCVSVCEILILTTCYRYTVVKYCTLCV